MTGEQAGQVAFAAAGVKDLAAGNIARQVEQAASKPAHETPQRSFADETDIGLVVFVVTVHLSNAPSAS